MTASKLIAARLIIAGVAVSIFPLSASSALLSIGLFVFATVLDIFDGLLADHKGHTKPFGGFLDIAADQCIETLFWFVFLKYDVVPLWIPAFILVRNSFINLLRMDAIAAGRTMFGDNGMLRSRFARVLVGARFSRGIMVLAKTVGFVAATLLYIGRKYGGASVPFIGFDAESLRITTITSLSALAAIHLVRGAIITLEARSSLDSFLWNARAQPAPKALGGAGFD